MPRRARIAIPHLPHHIVQRGHSRSEVFFGDSDRTDYLGTLGECRVLFGIKIYAYCLMTNHVHLVIDPVDRPKSLSLTMHRLAGRHARRLNLAHSWSGSIWESRFYCSPIETDRYLLTCGRYVDQNPVRARMVTTPAAYVWSSYRARAGLSVTPILDLDPAIEALSTTEQRRFEIYRQLAGIAISPDDLALIREASRRNHPTGDQLFVESMRETNDLDLPTRPQGRPRKVRKS